MNRFMIISIVLVFLGALAEFSECEEQKMPAGQQDIILQIDTGYRGIWYNIGDKYSGGLATYPQQIRPFAVYAEKVNKTFFCYGGRPADKNTLFHMVSYYDHAPQQVPRPRILLDKNTQDAHDNPCIALDDKGYIWIFSNTHGQAKRSYIHRSSLPYDINSFRQILHGSFSYGQPWNISGKGLLFVHNRYEHGRAVAFMRCTVDSDEWTTPALIAQFGGHYQVSGIWKDRVGVAFNTHHFGGLDRRTNLYYIETDTFGDSWHTADGKDLELPLKDADNPALVYRYHSDEHHLNVYLKDVAFTSDGRPVILYLTSRSADSGPSNDRREWHIASWTGAEWLIKKVATSDHNYDFGPLYIESDGTWRIIAPLDPGPQAWMTGGEIVMMNSNDAGTTWRKVMSMTKNSERNHTYVRKPVNAHAGFYAFWADGDPTTKASESHLYFSTKEGMVFELPYEMSGDVAHPQEYKN